jgi:hypothetical protein
MSIAHNQAALFGAIDAEVVAAKKRLINSDSTTLADQNVVRIVEAFLPGTTGFGRSGWFGELEQLFARVAKAGGPGTHGEPIFPDLTDAIAGLQDLPPQTERDHTSTPDDGDGFEDRTYYVPANDPVLARAGYAAMVLNKVHQAKAGPDSSPAGLSNVMKTAVQSFSFVTRNGVPGNILTDPETISTVATTLFEAANVQTRAGWLKLAREQVDGFSGASATRSAEFAQSAAVCYGSVVKSKGKYCSLVTSDYTVADVSVAQIESILDPINWKSCSKFFVRMDMNSPKRNGANWSRVNEQVSAEPQKYHLEVDLLFWKAKQQSQDGTLLVNYDMDPCQKSTCLVEVDNGYIEVSPTHGDRNRPGVRIRSTKQERIQGVSTSAMAALACIMGWNDVGREMFAGTARKVISTPGDFPNLKTFVPSIAYDPAEI